jgi:tetratricopeptide (TPR) repeat protein
MVYLAGIFPVIGFLKFYTQLYTYVADHYAYLPSAAIFALLAAAPALIWRRIHDRPMTIPIPVYASTMIVALLAGLALNHATLYRNGVGLWTAPLRVNPGAWVAHANIAAFLNQQHHQPQEALKHYQQSLAIHRHNETLYRIGCIQEELGNMAEAKAAYEQSIAAGLRYDDVHRRLARILLKEGRYAEAARILRAASMLSPSDPDMQLQLAICKRMLNKHWDAIHHCINAIEMDPDSLSAYFELGLNYAALGHDQEALNAFYRTVEIDPESFEARRHYAIMLRKTGQAEEAQRQMKIALELKANKNK